MDKHQPSKLFNIGSNPVGCYIVLREMAEMVKALVCKTIGKIPVIGSSPIFPIVKVRVYSLIG